MIDPETLSSAGQPLLVASALGLTPQQASIVFLLVRDHVVTRAQLEEVTTHPNITMHRLRERLNERGIVVRNHRGVGYFLTDASYEVLAGCLKAYTLKRVVAE